MFLKEKVEELPLNKKEGKKRFVKKQEVKKVKIHLKEFPNNSFKRGEM